MAEGKVILETQGLSRAFGGLVAVNSVDFQIREGTIHAIIGPNGAGKTTFLNLLSGIYLPTAGRIVFDGRDITGQPPHRISQFGIARTMQISSLFLGMTVYHNAWVAAQSRLAWLNPLASYQRLAGVRAVVDEVLKLLELSEKAGELVGNLSHGDQRLMEIAVALATRPRLLLLDEPTAGMSLKETQDTIVTIRRVAERVTVGLVEHDMDLVMALASTITVLDQGALLAVGTPEEIRSNRRVQEVYLGVR